MSCDTPSLIQLILNTFFNKKDIYSEKKQIFTLPPLDKRADSRYKVSTPPRRVLIKMPLHWRENINPLRGVYPNENETIA
jgi:hypothetical protein